MAKTYKPGQTAPYSGQYGLVGPRGGKIAHEITLAKHKTFPPTQKAGQQYVKNDPTHNKSGGR